MYTTATLCFCLMVVTLTVLWYRWPSLTDGVPNQSDTPPTYGSTKDHLSIGNVTDTPNVPPSGIDQTNRNDPNPPAPGNNDSASHTIVDDRKPPSGIEPPEGTAPPVGKDPPTGTPGDTDPNSTDSPDPTNDDPDDPDKTTDPEETNATDPQ